MGASLLAGLALARALAAGGDYARYEERQEGERFVIRGESLQEVLPCHVTVTFPALENLRASVPLPARFVLAPRERRDLLFLERLDPGRPARMNASYLTGLGDPGARPDATARYLFPWTHGAKFLVGQGYFGTYTHRGKHALDFQMPEGTPVCAARAGVVASVKADSTRGGPGPAFAPFANYVRILHADGTWAQYAHLKPGGAAVKPGETVAAGRVIGWSGKTGQAQGPHLHFEVDRASWEGEGGETIPTAFAHLDGAAVSPEEGKWYYAVHPGGAPFTPVLAERITDVMLEARTAAVPLDGKVRFRPESVDDCIYLWCANGLRTAQMVTLEFTALRNLAPSKPVPMTRTVPSGREMFFLTLRRTVRSGVAEYRLRSRLRPAGSG